VSSLLTFFSIFCGFPVHNSSEMRKTLCAHVGKLTTCLLLRASLSCIRHSKSVKIITSLSEPTCWTVSLDSKRRREQLEEMSAEIFLSRENQEELGAQQRSHSATSPHSHGR
jgi:hypothetical protein